MYCSNCGNKIKGDEKFCPYCGEGLKKEEINIETNNNTNSSNISLILGILACVFFWNILLSIPLAIASIVTGAAQKKKENKSQPGIILGIISIILSTVLVALLVIGAILITRDSIDWIEDKIEINEELENTSIKGYSWKEEKGSTLYLNINDTFIWYENEENKEDNYTKGTYYTYNGEDAINYIANTIKEFGVTEEDQRKILKDGNKKIENYYLLILTNEESKTKGDEIKEEHKKQYYYGFYNHKNEQLELINLSNADKIILTKKEDLEKIIL